MRSYPRQLGVKKRKTPVYRAGKPRAQSEGVAGAGTGTDTGPGVATGTGKMPLARDKDQCWWLVADRDSIGVARVFGKDRAWFVSRRN
jgi:hypothetical protein